MGTFTLTGPGASVDRSQNNALSFTWTQANSDELLHRWRLQYRTVGSGTWLNAVLTKGSQLLPNGSAESAITDWYASAYPTGQNSALSRIAGGRRAASGSWQVERKRLVYDAGNPNSDARHTVSHPLIPNGQYTFDHTQMVPVTPGGRYNFAGWWWTSTSGIVAGTAARASITWYNAAGSSVSPTYVWPTGQQTGWNNATAEVVAPAGAVWAYATIEAYSANAAGSYVRMDDWYMQRVDTSSDALVADATGEDWSYKYAGGPAGSGSAAPPVAAMTLTPNFLAAGNWEFRIEAWSGRTASGTTPIQSYSNTVTSTMVTAAAAPAITTPAADGATIAASPSNVVLTYASGQTQAQVRVMDGGTVKWDSGAVTVSGTTATIAATFAENGTARQIQARTAVGGVWSSWATRTVNVTYTVPATPTLTAAWEDTVGIGAPHAVRLTVTNPTPTGTQPTVTQMLLEHRVVGTTFAQTIAVITTSPFIWYAAPNRALEVRVTAYGNNGTSASTGWQAVTGTPGLKGVVLYDPANPSGVKMFRLNDDGADDEEQIESALLVFSGRQYPVAEFGAGTARTIGVPLLTLRQDADVLALKSLLRARAALVYRDKRGRAVLARMSLEPVKDEFYGYVTGLSFDVLDSWGA